MALGPATYNINIKRGVTFGPITVTCYSDDPPTVIFNLTGYTAHCQARRKPDDIILQDLGATVTNAAGGVITIPKFTDEQTLEFTLVNGGSWSLIVETSGGDWLPPIVAGTYNVTTSVTRDQP